MSSLFGYFLLVGLVQKIASLRCPNGSVIDPNENLCLIPVAEPKSYFDVIRYCGTFGGIPVKIENVFINAYVQAMTENFNGIAPYIGVERDGNDTLHYADGTPLIYQHWSNGQPQNDRSTICTIMNISSGYWASADCAPARPSICSSQGEDAVSTTSSTGTTTTTTSNSNHSCPKGWVYNGQTNYCYYLHNFTYSDGVTWDLYNFATAESDCNRLKGHLVSIHSKDEDNFVYDLIYSNVINMTNAAGGNDPCNYVYSWIGYKGNGSLGTGAWTDGSPVDYIGGRHEEGYDYWMNSNDDSCKERSWISTKGSAHGPRYVCKKMPSMKDDD